jgi:hypothetical protein
MNSDFVKGSLCLLAGVIWVTIEVQWVPNTNVGVAIILVQAGVLIFAGAIFLNRFRVRDLP